MASPAHKLQPTLTGPWRITHVLEGNVYKLEDQYGRTREEHVARLEPADVSRWDPREHLERSLPEGMAVVDEILDERVVAGNAEYLVRWYNRAESLNAWVPQDQLQSSIKLQQYLAAKAAAEPPAGGAPAP
jgi:hypothetical protein